MKILVVEDEEYRRVALAGSTSARGLVGFAAVTLAAKATKSLDILARRGKLSR